VPETGRFAFGDNWKRFGNVVDETRIAVAEASLRDRLGDLTGRTFLDAGCGSGLFSLAALRLGAARVYSFDFDTDSVEATIALRRRWSGDPARWRVERGDVLDRRYTEALAQWDVVYSWGVLHHTGDMRRAWANVAPLVAPGGHLFISIYNDQRRVSRLWTAVKRSYQRVPRPFRAAYVVIVMAPREAVSAVLTGPRAYIRSWRDYKANRGMSRWHDLVDWVGGYPFEVAAPDEVFEFFHRRGFGLEWMLTCGAGSGCNQFVFFRGAENAGRVPSPER
jgi:2-polyprenyl-3-methyl-5-hydroxy-6-metoxy-1,4-benzoquinol methylase